MRASRGLVDEQRASTHGALDVRVAERVALDDVDESCVRGTRISVGDVLGFLASGMAPSQDPSVMARCSKSLSRDAITKPLARANSHSARSLYPRNPSDWT
jgi:hypothetical protein